MMTPRIVRQLSSTRVDEAITLSMTALTLSVGGGSAALEGKVSVHLIPRVDLGVSLLFGAASASVFLELDGYGELDMNLEANFTTVDPTSSVNVAIVSTPTSPEAISTSLSAITASTNSTGLASEVSETTESSEAASTSAAENIVVLEPEASTTIPVVNDIAYPPSEDTITTPMENYTSPSEAPSSSPTAAAPTGTRSPRFRRHRRRQQQTEQKRDLMLLHKSRDASESYNGCVGVNMGVKIVAGAQGKLLSFWSDSASFDIFAVDWPIFNVSPPNRFPSLLFV